MSQKDAVNRLKREYQLLCRNPNPQFIAKPDPLNLFDFHFVIFNLPNDTPFTGGVYHGSLKFPSNYPHAPPQIQFHTQSGRFQVNTRLCMSMSDFHPEEWSPMWRVESIILGIISFMLSQEITTGGLRSSTIQKIKYARESWENNMSNQQFVRIFEPELEMLKSKFN